MAYGIRDKVVVITGASSGLGEATARLLSSQGARVVLGARRAARLRSLASEIAEKGAPPSRFRRTSSIKTRSELWSNKPFRPSGGST